MLKKLLAIVAFIYASLSFAAVDVNKGTAADLDSVKGIGPSISSRIVDERKKGNFKDWNDFIERVKGVGEGNAAKFSEAGLTVNGATFKGAAPAVKKDDKPAKTDDKKADAKVKADDQKADAKAEKKDSKAAEKKDTKVDKKEAKTGKKDKAEKKDAKADKKEEKKDDKKDSKATDKK
jgi:competence protein ComEA